METFETLSMIAAAYKADETKNAVDVWVRNNGYWADYRIERYPNLATYWSTRLGYKSPIQREK
jgi:hypothetical protein